MTEISINTIQLLGGSILSEKLKIDVTPNLKKSLEFLEEAIQELPSGELKDKAKGAVEYLSRTFRGEPQPLEGKSCPAGILFIPAG